MLICRYLLEQKPTIEWKLKYNEHLYWQDQEAKTRKHYFVTCPQICVYKKKIQACFFDISSLAFKI